MFDINPLYYLERHGASEEKTKKAVPCVGYTFFTKQPLRTPSANLVFALQGTVRYFPEVRNEYPSVKRPTDEIVVAKLQYQKGEWVDNIIAPFSASVCIWFVQSEPP